MTHIYHDGHRRLQDQFDSGHIADQLAQVTLRTAFTACTRARRPLAAATSSRSPS
jgi:hypothetical protein